MDHLLSVDASLALEVQITREIFDKILAKARLQQVKALYAYHAHEKAAHLWNQYVGAMSTVDQRC